jgi:hypothetical protein
LPPDLPPLPSFGDATGGSDAFSASAAFSADEHGLTRRDAPLPSYADEELDSSNAAAPLPSFADDDPEQTRADAPLPSYADEELGPELGAPAEAPVAAVATPVSAPPPAAETASVAPAEPIVDGVLLADVRGLQDLPEDAQLRLATQAKVEDLRSDEEVSGFGVALVLSGDVRIMPAIADVACATAGKGDVVFTVGSLEEGVLLRVVAGAGGARVAVWQAQALQEATAPCPWVADELRVVADRYQALAGAVMGAMGDRLDDALRKLVTDRCEVRVLLGREVLVEASHPVNGLYIVGAGRIELLEGSGDAGEITDELGPGDFLFAEEVLSGGKAPATARAGKTGALLLHAPRMTAHELLVSVPPLLEILAG